MPCKSSVSSVSASNTEFAFTLWLKASSRSTLGEASIRLPSPFEKKSTMLAVYMPSASFFVSVPLSVSSFRQAFTEAKVCFAMGRCSISLWAAVPRLTARSAMLSLIKSGYWPSSGRLPISWDTLILEGSTVSAP